jgi:hypothetical protein
MINILEYHEVTGAGLGRIDPYCPGYLAAAMDELEALIKSQEFAALEYVRETFL